MATKNSDQMKELVSLLYPHLEKIEPELPEKQGVQGLVLLYPDVAIKMPRGDNEWSLSSIRREASMLRELAGMDTGNIHIPSVIDYDSSNNVLVSSRMKGRILTQEMMLSMTRMHRYRLGRDLGFFLYHLHSFMFSASSSLISGNLEDDFRELLCVLDDVELWGRANITKIDIPEIQKYIEIFLSTDEDKPILHDDISIGNILYDEESGHISIIDFAGCSQGFRHRDFRRMGNFHPEIHEACLNAYNSLSAIQVTPQILSVSRKAESLRRVYRGNGGLEMVFIPS